MFSYGTLTPATFQTVGSTPSYSYIWAATSSSDPYKALLVSTDGKNWTKTSFSGTNYVERHILSFNKTTKEVMKINASSTTYNTYLYTYNALNGNKQTKSVPVNVTGSTYRLLTSSSNPVVFDNARNLWEIVANTTSDSSGAGRVAKQTSTYLTTTNGTVSGVKLSKQSGYKIINSDTGDLFIIKQNTTSNNAYFLPSNRDFTGGTYINESTNLNNALTTAGFSNKYIQSVCYMPDVGFVFVFMAGVAIYNTSSNSWSVTSINFNMMTGYSLVNSPRSMCYEPARKRLYFAAQQNDDLIRVLYTQDGTNWNTLGTIDSSNGLTTRSQPYPSVSASNDCVLLVGGDSNGYCLYDYNTNIWTKNSGITITGGSSNEFFPQSSSDRYIYCFPYTND